jgi:hypothetical protein
MGRPAEPGGEQISVSPAALGFRRYEVPKVAQRRHVPTAGCDRFEQAGLHGSIWIF